MERAGLEDSWLLKDGLKLYRITEVKGGLMKQTNRIRQRQRIYYRYSSLYLLFLW
jgi:hypothetical protein